MAGVALDLGLRRMLLADWFVCLARESDLDFTQRGSGDGRYTIGDQKAFHVVANFTEKAPFLTFVASDESRQTVIDEIAANASDRVEAGDFGGVVWYSTTLHEVELQFSPFSIMGPFLQQLGSQTRIVGWRRLGTSILLEFVEEIPEGWADQQQILAPKALVHVHVAAPGPCAGDFSSHTAHGVIETVGAICTFALGRPVQLPHGIFPAKDEHAPELDRRRADPEILTLARKGTSLDIFSWLVLGGGSDVFLHARAALVTFDAAVRQERDSVAAILYVVATESLTTPNAPWRLQKLTKRFITFFDELMPGDLDQIVGHGNFEESFGIRRGTRTARVLRRELLDHIYAYRSGQLHEGLNPSYRGLGVAIDPVNETRRGLLGDFAEAAILRYLEAPRVSLIGHPGFDRSEDELGRGPI